MDYYTPVKETDEMNNVVTDAKQACVLPIVVKLMN